MSGRRRGALRIGMALVVAGTVSLTSPTRANVPPASPLAGRSVFEASAPGFSRVELRRESSISIEAATSTSPQIEVEGVGRLSGIFLMPDGPNSTSKDRPVGLFAMQVGGCWAQGCGPESPFKRQEYVSPIGIPAESAPGGFYRVTLRAGIYRVFYVVDGGPVRVTLRLAGFEGASRHAAVERRPLVLRSLESPPVVDSLNPYHSVGSSSRISTPKGLLFFIEGVQYSPHVTGRGATCYYRDREPPGGVYAPLCPYAEGGSNHEVTAPALTSYHGLSYSGSITTVPGEWNFGSSRAAVGGKSRFRITQLWMDLGD